MNPYALITVACYIILAHLAYLMRVRFCVWCVKCAKYLTFDTFSTSSVSALTDTSASFKCIPLFSPIYMRSCVPGSPSWVSVPSILPLELCKKGLRLFMDVLFRFWLEILFARKKISKTMVKYKVK